MENRTTPAKLLDTLFLVWKDKYFVRVLYLLQIPFLFTSALGFFYVSLNVVFTSAVLSAFIRALIILALVSSIITFLVMMALSANIRAKLKAWANRLPFTGDETAAWFEITSFSWRATVAISVIAFVVILIPIIVYLRTAHSFTIDNLIHVFLGGSLAIMLNLLVFGMSFEYVLTPVRTAILPENPVDQLAGMGGMNFKSRLLINTFIMIILTLLLIAPRGYQIAIDFMRETGQLLAGQATLQGQLIVISLVALTVGLLVSNFFARLSYRPVDYLIDTMKKVREGDTTARAQVVATDELGTLTVFFNNMLDDLHRLRSGLETDISLRTDALEKKTAQLQAVVAISRQVATIRDIQELLNRTTAMVSSHFGHYHAAIYWIDEYGQSAVLQATSSEIGAQMQSRNYHINLNEKSLIASAVATQKAQIALYHNTRATTHANPFFQQTRAQIALPITIQARTIGVVDIHSRDENAFSADDIPIFQTLADQIGLAVENARLLSDSQSIITRLELLSAENVRQAWQEDLRRNTHAYKYTPLGTTTITEDNHPNEYVDQHQRIQVPIQLRGQTLGNITLTRPKESHWTEEEKELIAKVSAQIGLAIDNARLLSNAQNRAQQELAITEIVNKATQSLNVEALLQTTVRELGNTVGATKSFVQIGFSEEDNL